MKGLLSEAYADERRKLIDLDARQSRISVPAIRGCHDGDTIYLTTADKDGMMVSLIQSNYRGMGSGLVADHLGFMFQDRGELYLARSRRRRMSMRRASGRSTRSSRPS